MTMLTIQDIDGPIEITFDDLKKFHGTRSICGLTVGYTMLRAAWESLSDGKPLDRSTIEVETAFGGPGGRDAVEMVTRAVSREAFKVVGDKQPDTKIAEAAKGAYWYRVSAGGKAVELGLKPDVMPKEFVRLRRLLLANEATAEQRAEFRALQLELSNRLLSMEPLDAFNVLSTVEAT